MLQDLGLLDGKDAGEAAQLVSSSLALADSDNDGALCQQVGQGRGRSRSRPGQSRAAKARRYPAAGARAGRHLT